MSGTSSIASAVWFDQPRSAILRQEPLRDPERDELLVEAICSLVSAGTEMTIYRGEVASESEVGLPTRKGGFPFPISFGYQVVGRVSQTGPDAPHQVGDVVLCQHPHQDRFVISSRFVVPVPADTPPEAAAFANLCGVALNGHLDVPVRIGDCCVVFGLGIIGRFAAELARRTAGRLILVDPFVERRDAALRVGADAVVAPSELASAVDQLTAGRGVDVAIEVSGHPDAFQQAIECTGPEGTIAILSYYGQREVTLRLSPEFHLRRQRIVSSAVRDLGSGLQPRWDKSRRTATAMQLVRTIDTQAMISHRVAFAEAPRAYDLLDREPASTLGVLLEYK
jgi:2-desacetyl-2-hydroxyethyl bacteriochlorophyllide A dehydrogenase